MAENKSVSLDSILDAGSFNARQAWIVFCTALAIVFDGMDIQLMGFTIPAIAKDWHLSKAAFTPVLALGLFGVTLGAVAGGIVGDRLGRRRALLLNVLLFAIATLLMAEAHSIPFLLFFRFIAGVGIGGALPNAATLTAEFTQPKNRAAAITLTIICVPLGGLLAGLIASHLLPVYGWRVLFVIGGGGPLLLLLLLFFSLPESPRFLARQPSGEAELRKILRRIGRPVADGISITVADLEAKGVSGFGLHRLFEGSLRRDTPSLWIAFFCSLTTVYLVFNWLPSILSGQGIDLKGASQGLAAYNLGGILGALIFAFWVNARGSRRPLLLGAASAALTGIFCGIAIHTHMPMSISLLLLLAANGLFTNAVQTTLYALAAHLYTTSVRATGVAGALAIGRTGAILSAFIGGAILAIPAEFYFATLAIGMVGVYIALSVLKHHIMPATLPTEE